MKQRTEQDIHARTPLSVHLGDKDYEVKLLASYPAQQWREKFADVLKGTVMAGEMKLPTGVDLSAWLKGQLTSSISLVLARSPEKVADLIFAYATSPGESETYLPKTEIMESATDAQLNLAFSQIMSEVFPFFTVLGMMQEIMKATPQPSASLLN